MKQTSQIQNNYGVIINDAFGCFSLPGYSNIYDAFAIIQLNDTLPYVCDPRVKDIDDLIALNGGAQIGRYNKTHNFEGNQNYVMKFKNNSLRGKISFTIQRPIKDYCLLTQNISFNRLNLTFYAQNKYDPNKKFELSTIGLPLKENNKTFKNDECKTDYEIEFDSSYYLKGMEDPFYIDFSEYKLTYWEVIGKI